VCTDASDTMKQQTRPHSTHFILTFRLTFNVQNLQESDVNETIDELIASEPLITERQR
jgi:hypothetical protein